jgi:hypothetical protein
MPPAGPADETRHRRKRKTIEELERQQEPGVLRAVRRVTPDHIDDANVVIGDEPADTPSLSSDPNEVAVMQPWQPCGRHDRAGCTTCSGPSHRFAGRPQCQRVAGKLKESLSVGRGVRSN